MRLSLYYLVLLLMMELVSLNEIPASSSSGSLPGHARLRLRAHRRRHRHRGNNVETDELFEMLTRDIEDKREADGETERVTMRETDETRDADNTRERTRKTKNTPPVRRERNEPLCDSERTTVDLNSVREEFDPPFLVETRCRNTADYEKRRTDSLEEQKCVHDLLRCVQRYGEVHLSRRPVGSAHWLPHTLRDVPLGCDCMWPVDKYGHQEL